MAYIGKASIKCSAHMENAVGYIARQEKAMPLEEMKAYLEKSLSHMSSIDTSMGERTTLINCSPQNTAFEFETVRMAFNQDKGIIAHHYYQSFDKDDDVTPDLAHQIGVELAKRMFPNFQVVAATHIDRDHVHNHIIVNSVNLETGQKWYSDKRSLYDIRSESDKLCLENGLSVIDKNNKYKSIDRTTYQLGLKGKSWKVNLIRGLDKAAETCRSKEEFIAFLSDKDYTVKYTDTHITITKNGEKKGIRVDTLAKQFGGKYTKANLEKLMGYYEAPPEMKAAVAVKKKPYTKGKSNYERYEQYVFKKNGYLPSTTEKIVRDYKVEKLIRDTKWSMLRSRSLFEFVMKALTILVLIPQRRKKIRIPVKYKRVQQLTPSKSKSYIPFGNAQYDELRATAGDIYTCKVGIEKLLNLVNQPILYAAKISRADNTATITVKEKDRGFLLALLEMQEKARELDKQNEQLQNQRVYRELKAAAEETGVKLQYLVITEEQKRILRENYIKFACFEKGDKVNIAFLPEKAELIKRLIYVPKEEKMDSRADELLKKGVINNSQKLI